MALKLDIHDLDDLVATHAPHLIAPPEPAAPSFGGPAAPSSGAMTDPSVPTPIDRPTRKQSNEAGKREFEAGRPTVTSDPGTPGYYKEQIQKQDYEKQHPWGSPISEHPGFLGKVGHVLAKVGNVAGDIVAPEVMQNIPGSDMNKQLERTGNERKLEQATKDENTKEYKDAVAENTALKTEQGQAKIDQAGQKELDALAEHGLTRDEKGNIGPLSEDKLSPQVKQKLAVEKTLAEFRKAQTALADAREEVARAQNDPNSPQFQMAMKKMQMAQLAHEIAAQNLGLHQQQFTNKLQEQDLVKPSGQSQSRGSAAQAALNLLPDLQQQIRANAHELGPIFGRLAKGEIAIGNVDPKIAKLYSALSSFYALNPAIHGFRNFEFVKDMPSFIGGLERDPEGTIAGLEGLRPTLESVAKEGKTYHHRIIEGQEKPATAASGGETQIHNGFEYTKGADGQWHKGKPAKQ